MILYRKAPPLRVQRNPFPQPPYWAATSIAPYGTRHGAPLAIDYIGLLVQAADRAEAAVCEDVQSQLARVALREPLLVEATGTAETVFRRGEAVVQFCCERHLAPMQLVSADGALPGTACQQATIVIATWPPAAAPFRALSAEARARGLHWGAAVPVIFPLTTDLTLLASIAETAQANGASFLAALPVEVDASARKAIAQTVADRESYDMLFHADLEPLHVATERHIAALAAEIGIDDFIIPPSWDERSNWNAAALLTLVATRMLAMKRDVETASRIARSARTVAQLEKPLEVVAAAASLSIIDGVDDVSADVLTDWLESGHSAFVEHITKQWRLRRDAGM